MKQSPKYSFEYLDQTFRTYHLLIDYYSGKLWEEMECYQDIASELAKSRYLDNELVNKGLELIGTPDADTIYDFNKLFIGPGKLLAPPYESYYRNPEKLFMQKETMAVREFYSSAGVNVKRLNSQPDDFIALEFEFICFLLYKAAAHLSNDPDMTDYYLQLYSEFLNKHLSKWIFDHCQDILAKSTSDFCKGMAIITQGFIEDEIKQIA